MEEQIKALPKRIIQAQEEERERISWEIHDDLGQSLVTLKMLIQSAMLEADTDKTNARRSYDKVIKSFDAVIEKTRSISSGLRPSSLEMLGLTAAIKGMVNEFKQGKNLKICLAWKDATDNKTDSLNLDNLIFLAEPINFYRIIQEALTNIVKHAKATRADILLKKRDNQLSVVIKDNGIGLTPRKRESKNHHLTGLGLSIMEERARLLGGEFNIVSSPKGTALQFKIPVEHEGADDGGA